jgi:hypothetical protein
LPSGFGGALPTDERPKKGKSRKSKIIDSQLEQVLKQSEAISAPENIYGHARIPLYAGYVTQHADACH